MFPVLSNLNFYSFRRIHVTCICIIYNNTISANLMPKNLFWFRRLFTYDKSLSGMVYLRFQQQLDLKFYFLLLVVDHHKHWGSNWFGKYLFLFLKEFVALIAQATSIPKPHLTFSIVFVIVNPRFALSLSIKPLFQRLSAALVHIPILQFSFIFSNSSLASSLPLSLLPLSTVIIYCHYPLPIIFLGSQKIQSDTEIFFNSWIFLFGIHDMRIWWRDWSIIRKSHTFLSWGSWGHSLRSIAIVSWKVFGNGRPTIGRCLDFLYLMQIFYQD